VRGLDVSLGSLGQDQLVERQVGHSPAKPRVLRLKLLQALHLVALQPALLVPPAAIGHLRHVGEAIGLRCTARLSAIEVIVSSFFGRCEVGEELLGRGLPGVVEGVAAAEVGVDGERL